ncbi:MAG TPA: hypothetical protein VN963_06450 [bacterium]|nr:hypothetical protein [bacterium]
MKKYNPFLSLFIGMCLWMISFSGFGIGLLRAQSTPDVVLDKSNVTEQKHRDRPILFLSKLKGVEFLDENGNVKYHFERYAKNVTVNGLGQDSGMEVIHSGNGKYYFITKYDVEELSEAQSADAGETEKVFYDTYVYDWDGNLVFKKQKSPYRVDAISENGKFVVCLIDEPGHYYGGGEGDPIAGSKLSTRMGEVAVFSVNGKRVYQCKENYIGRGWTKLSPSGNWLFFFSIGGNYGAKVVNLNNFKVYLMPDANQPRSASYITDDGSVISHDRKFSRDSKGNLITKFKDSLLYSPDK